MARVYYRPVDLLEGPAALRALDAGEALGLAGGAIGFQSIEICDRAGNVERVPVSRWADAGASEIKKRLTRARPAAFNLPTDSSLVMGILNVTPDSFSDGGDHIDLDDLIKSARQMKAQGADLWDIGGESTRPGSDPVSVDEELARVLPAIDALSCEKTLPISIDSRKPDVFKAAINKGACIINDVSALTWSPGSLAAAASLGAAVVLMHAQGDPKTMQDEPCYDNVLFDVYDWLEARVLACEGAGIKRSNLVLDPGIGFGKTLDHNLALLKGLSLFHGLGCSLMLGASRKNFIHKLHSAPAPKERLGGSVAAVLAARRQGVQIFRVHDVQATKQALIVAEAIDRSGFDG